MFYLLYISKHKSLSSITCTDKEVEKVIENLDP